MADLTTDIRTIKGIGEARAKALGKLGITNLRELISWFPRKYDDRRQAKRIADLVPGEAACVAAMIASPPTVSHIRKGMTLVKVRAVDDSGTLDVTFFNQTWLKEQLQVGETYIFYGKAEGNLLRKTMASPIVEQEGKGEFTGRIVPVYPLTAGVSQLILSRSVRQGLDECRDILPDVLPNEVRQAHHLCRIGYAYENIHFPADEHALDLARRRLAFEELFLFSIGLQRLRQRRETVSVPPCKAVDMEGFYSALPFTLTGAQKRCVEEAIADMRSGAPMNRLCQGDVGSGKTMVAAACVYFAVKNGRQAALMAPTEILAQQHYNGLAPLMEQLGIRCALLTGSTKAATKRSTSAQLSTGEIDFAIGTHALITGSVEFADLGLVVTDEQHRFGVAQRSALAAKGQHPHTLVMSATPIPRTLALILYGDLDVSILDELPPGREPVDTFLVDESYRARINAFIRKHVAEDHQVYVVCPAVEENEALNLKAAETWAQTLQQTVFPDLKVALLHGQMKGAEKDAVMSAFSKREADILVATTVIEVGVDVPNATLMVIEDADRFGLSQLHQLRGRVGRGKAKSFCVLTSHSKNSETLQRIKAFCKTNDGFKIAEEDLALRGPGDFFGARQSGLPVFRVANLACDLATLKQAQEASANWIDTAGIADTPEAEALRSRIGQLFLRAEGTMN